MKKLTLILALFSFATLLSAQTGNDYSSKSGKISYRYEFDNTELSYSLVFDEFGKKQAIGMESKDNGVIHKSKTIITQDAMFIINYEDKQGIKFPTDTDNKSMDMYGGENAGFDFSGMVAEVSGDVAGKIGTETILGKQCDIYKYSESDGSKGKYWIYKEYLLKAEFIDEEGQNTYMEATEFEIGIAIDKKEFEVPSNFDVTDMTEMMKEMQQMQQMYGIPE